MPAPLLDGPPVQESDPRALLLGYLDWYRDALLRKIDGLTEQQLRMPAQPLGWSPLGIVKHLGWVERRWLRWGFAAQDVAPEPPGGRATEFVIDADESTARVLAAYHDEVAMAAAVVADAALGDQARTGGRFTTPDQAPPLGRILFHLLQEYARHLGHLDIGRELIDGSTGE